MFELLKKVLTPCGPTGMETLAADVIEQEVAPYVDCVRRDALGNLIATRKGTDPNGKKIMFSAHMDHIAFIVTGFEDDGTLRVTNVGGINIANSVTRHVAFVNGVQGIVTKQPTEGNAAMQHMFIDIGAQDKAEAQTMVQLGDLAVYAPDCFRMGAHRVASPAMDDRSACAMLVRLLQTMPAVKDTVIAVFSVQEEVGCRGARVAAFSEEPDIGIALDVTAWGDTPETKQPAIRLGDGIAVKWMDRGSISNPALRDALMACAQRNDIRVQREVLPFGGTDASAMQTARGGIPVCTLSIPCRYVHSACEVVDLRDLEAGVALMICYLTQC